MILAPLLIILGDKMNKLREFENIRNWSKIRGVGTDNKKTKLERLQIQYQRVLQECVEIHDSIIKEDLNEFKDAIGDTIVTLINLANIIECDAEVCLDQAFNVIKLRKGLNKNGDFIRYKKLSKDEQLICDIKQGNANNEYFLEENIKNLSPDSFKI